MHPRITALISAGSSKCLYAYAPVSFSPYPFYLILIFTDAGNK
jgi:hypothetical protein